MAARSLNKVTLIGNLTRDPELRYTPQGTAVCTMGLATNRSWMPTDGTERKEEAEFHRIVAWTKLAEICSQLLYKGRKVYFEGRLQTRKWQTADGQDRETTEVVVSDMIALGAPKEGAVTGEGQYSRPTPASSKSNPNPSSADFTGGDNQETVQEATSKSSTKEPAVDDKKPSDNKDKASEDVSVDDIPF